VAQGRHADDSGKGRATQSPHSTLQHFPGPPLSRSSPAHHEPLRAITRVKQLECSTNLVRTLARCAGVRPEGDAAAQAVGPRPQSAPPTESGSTSLHRVRQP
jgi:hypothetical protein